VPDTVNAVLYYLLVGIFELAIFLLPAVFLLHVNGVSWQTVFGRRAYGGSMLLAACMAVAGIWMINLLQVLWLLLLSRMGYSMETLWAPSLTGMSSRLLAVASIAGTAAFAEEITLRGMLLPAMERRWGRVRAVVFSSVVFMLLHGSLLNLPYTLLLGMLLATLTIRSGSLWPSIAYHFTHNAVIVLMTGGLGYTGAAVPGMDDLLKEYFPSMMAGVFWTVFALIFLFACLFFWLLWKGFSSRFPRKASALRSEREPLGAGARLCLVAGVLLLIVRMALNTAAAFG